MEAKLIANVDPYPLDYALPPFKMAEFLTLATL
jgi:hypothetical protein